MKRVYLVLVVLLIGLLSIVFVSQITRTGLRVIRPSLLHVAAAKNDIDEALQLIDQGALIDEPFNQRVSLLVSIEEDYRGPYWSGSTPLMIAIKNDHCEMARLLLANGASPNTANTSGFTPLIYATKFSGESCLRLLLQNHADVNMQDLLGRTAMMHAASLGRIDLVRVLLEFGCDLSVRTFENATVLMCAAESGNEETTTAILEAVDGVNLVDDRGQHALISAARHGSLAVVRLLVDAGSDRDLKDISGLTAADYAKNRTDERGRGIFQFLVDR